MDRPDHIDIDMTGKARREIRLFFTTPLAVHLCIIHLLIKLSRRRFNY